MGTQGCSLSLVQAVVLLAVSFFVLLAALKSDSKPLKTFGYAIAVLLWISAALVLGKAMVNRYCAMNKMHMLGGKERGSMMGRQMQQQADNPVAAK